MKKTFVRLLVIIPVIAIQALWLVLLIRWLSPYSAVINFILSIFAAFFVLYIITKRDESTYKILWLLIILTMPLAGAAVSALRQQALGKDIAGASQARGAAACHWRSRSSQGA